MIVDLTQFDPGRQIRIRRQLRCEPVRRLAVSVGVSCATISLIERGLWRSASPDLMRRIETVLTQWEAEGRPPQLPTTATGVAVSA